MLVQWRAMRHRQVGRQLSTKNKQVDFSLAIFALMTIRFLAPVSRLLDVRKVKRLGGERLQLQLCTRAQSEQHKSGPIIRTSTVDVHKLRRIFVDDRGYRRPFDDPQPRRFSVSRHVRQFGGHRLCFVVWASTCECAR